MIKIKETTENNFLIEISPNYSLRGWNRIIFLGSLAFICLSIGVFFFIMGAGLILPFAGLELTILFIAFYLSFKWSSNREKIYISQDIVKIEKGIKKAKYSWEEFRTFTSFQIKRNKDKSIRLSFRSKGVDVYIGDFLNDDDKLLLKSSISEIIDDLNKESNLSM